MAPDPELAKRFSRDFDPLIPPGVRAGIAVSGGPDSLALLLLAAAARPGAIEAATVDHALRPSSGDEAETVGRLCERIRIPHRILRLEWQRKPETAIQERARAARYHHLAEWANERSLAAIVTAHHLDDQAETLIMRLARGSGVRGLAGMRPVALVPGSDVALVRPLLGWRRSELVAICERAGVEPAADPSNDDEQFERVRLRRSLNQSEWLDPRSLASSAAYLQEADFALEWATRQEWARAVTNGAGEIVYRPGDAPGEIRRRIVSKAVARFAGEGQGTPLKGRELDRLLLALSGARTVTIRGVWCRGGDEWRFARAPARRG